MICPKCQAEVPDGVKFCPSCGESVLESVSDKVEEVAESAEKAVEETVKEEVKDDESIPTASFDPGAPIAVPKKKVEEAAAEVDAAVEEKIPEVAPVESVLPEFPQTDAKPEPAPLAPPIPETAVQPAPVVAAAPVAPAPLTPETIAAPVSSSSAAPDTSVSEDVSKENKPLSVGGAFWMLLLFAIPVVGLICSIIFSVAGKKKSRKNLSRAVLIWKVIGIILALVAFILIYFLVAELFEAIMGGDINDIIDAINNLTGA